MASNLIKVLSIGGGIATLGAGGATTYFLLREKEKPIAVLLAENGKVLLSAAETSEDAQWATNWGEFKKVYTANNAPTGNWAIEGTWSTVFSASEVNTNFKTKCATNAETKVKSKDNELYKEVEKYCTKDRTNA